MPARAVTLSSVRIVGVPSETAYHPGALSSLECENGCRAAAGSFGIAPTVGSIAKSPKTLHPGPLKCVRLNPVISRSVYSYPPPAFCDGVSGLH